MTNDTMTQLYTITNPESLTVRQQSLNELIYHRKLTGYAPTPLALQLKGSGFVLGMKSKCMSPYRPQRIGGLRQAANFCGSQA